MKRRITKRGLSRREVLAAATAMATALSGRSSLSAVSQSVEDERREWANWSRSVSCEPLRIESPASQQEVVDIVRQAIRSQQTVRAAGSGHSFVPLVATDDILVVDGKLRGVVEIDAEAGTVTALAGTKLYQLHRPLRAAGFSMINLPDIDRQTVAGAIATGTHGTGKDLGNLSSQVVGLELVTGEGEVVRLSKKHRPDLLKAAQVSLGALGVLTHVTLRVLPSYRLLERTSIASFDEMVEQLDRRIEAHRHYEFFWVSDRDACLMKTLDITEASEDVERYEDPEKLTGEKIGHSSEIFPSARNTRFNEIEFSLPAERGLECLRELRQLMLTKHKDVTWPLEYRTVAADDIYLSPAYDRPSITISAHQPADIDPWPFFSDVQAIFRNHEGRPHWGKMHSLGAEELSDLYPRWDAFAKARMELDAHGRFLNDHLRHLLG